MRPVLPNIEEILIRGYSLAKVSRDSNVIAWVDSNDNIVSMGYIMQREDGTLRPEHFVALYNNDMGNFPFRTILLKEQ